MYQTVEQITYQNSRDWEHGSPRSGGNGPARRQPGCTVHRYIGCPPIARQFPMHGRQRVIHQSQYIRSWTAIPLVTLPSPADLASLTTSSGMGWFISLVETRLGICLYLIGSGKSRGFRKWASD